MAADRPRNRAGAPKAAGKPPLTYYRSGERSQKSPFEAAQRKKQSGRFSKFIDFTIIALILAGLAYSLIIRPNPKLIVDSEVYHQASVYHQAAIERLDKLKNRTKLSFGDKEIIKSMQQQFPEISDATVDLPLFSQTPKIRLAISRPSFFLNDNGTNYIIDTEGVAVGKSADNARVKNLPTVIDQTGFATQAGRQILSAQEVGFINTIIAQARRAKVSIASLTLPPLAQQIDLKTTDRNYFTKFYLDGDPLVEAGQFLAARQQFDQSGNQPALYLDVRVNGKIYYK
jgi:cell division septal protein FtsQ